jgi:N,N'-diacetylchitobiose transport system permease protein
VTHLALSRRGSSLRRPGSKTGSRKIRARRIGLNLLALLVALITLFPIFYMVSTSLKPAAEIETLTPHLLPSHPTLSNYRAVLDGSAAGIPYWTFLRNSLFVTVSAVVASSLVALMAAIAVARFRFRLRTTYLIMLLIVQMLPQQALVIALFLDYKSWFSGYLLDNLVGLLLVYTAFALPVTIWMLRNFVAAVPKEMEEAAAIDGAGPYKVFFKVLLPLVTPGLIATSVFAFIFAYNEFVFALTFLLTDEPKYTLPLFVQYFYSNHGADWGAIMASSTLFTIPIMVFFLLVRRRMANGLVAGAVKG